MDKVQKLIDTMSVKLKKNNRIEASYYDSNTNTIFLSRITSCPLFKLLTKRPAQSEWSITHEVGHALVNFLSLERSKECRRLFGDFAIDYPDDGLLFSMFLEEDKDYITKYAQVHPEEDFADTFAFCLCGDKQQLKGKSKKVRDKVKFVKSLIQKTLKKRR